MVDTKTCETCRHWQTDQDVQGHRRNCMMDVGAMQTHHDKEAGKIIFEVSTTTPSDFGCNRWQAKPEPIDRDAVQRYVNKSAVHVKQLDDDSVHSWRALREWLADHPPTEQDKPIFPAPDGA